MFSFKKPFPWNQMIQLVGGLALIVGISLLAIRYNPFVSAWDEENSTFYDNSLQALRMFGVNPAAPTAIVFWEMDDRESLEAVKAFEISPSNLRIYGVHLSTSDDKFSIRKTWLENAPSGASVLLDRSQLLQTSFQVRTPPMVYIILPKQKKIFSYLGDIRHSKRRFIELVRSE